MLACQSLSRFYALLENEGQFLTNQAADQAELFMDRFLQHYQWLHEWAKHSSKLMYHFVPKFHFCHHLARQARFMNPRWTWTYKAEDWVGKLSKMAASCTPGTRSTRLSLKVADKYRYLLHFRLAMKLHDD